MAVESMLENVRRWNPRLDNALWWNPRPAGTWPSVWSRTGRTATADWLPWAGLGAVSVVLFIELAMLDAPNAVVSRAAVRGWTMRMRSRLAEPT